MTARSVAASVVLALTVLAAVSPGAEVPQSLSDQQVAAIAAKAPAVPVDLGLDLKTRLIDFIDCTDPKDLHDFKDQGTSSVTSGPAGKYRVTAAHRHAFFSYRFRSAGKDNPVLIVFEYPDDALRTINFSTHESALTGRANSDWSLETGVYCGEPFPLTNKMQYHTFIMWAQDEWPCVLVGNFHRYGHPAAASRIWVYAIEAPLPKLQVNDPDAANPRLLGHYNSRGYYLAQRLYFGLRSPKAVEHMLDYFDYIGVNLLSWGVVHSDDATIPSWGIKGTHLDEVLSAMDARGNFKFIACLYKPLGKVAVEEAKATLIKGCDEFLDHYGKYKSLAGISIGAMYGTEPMKEMLDKGIADEVVAHVRSKRPDLQVGTYVGGPHLHGEYFPGGEVPTAGDIITRWEKSGKTWSEVLAEAAGECWKVWGKDPQTLKKVQGLTLWEQYQPDDERIFSNYQQQPRSLMYFDLDNSAERSRSIDTPYAAFWNTHYEGWYGLAPDVNFWYQKHWVAPDFNAPAPLSLFYVARALGHRDRLGLMPGSWNVRYFGHESAMRRFAKAFRSLPPVEMADLKVMISGNARHEVVEEGLLHAKAVVSATVVELDTIKVRWVIHEGKRYVALLNRTPFKTEIAVDSRRVALPPYELVTLVDAGSDKPMVSGTRSMEYTRWVEDRITRFMKLYEEVKALNAAAAPEVYAKVAETASVLLSQGRAYAADVTLGAGLVGEMELRKEILDRPQLAAPRVGAAPKLSGDLDAWPKEASDFLAEGGQYLAGHTYFPNSWSGPDDLSARLRMCHDGTKLYVGIEVRDSVVAEYEENWNRVQRMFKRADSCAIRLSTDGAYLDWMLPASRGSDVTWPISLPFDGGQTNGKGRAGFEYTCRRTPKGYLIEGSADLAQLNTAPGGSIGFLLYVADVDKTPNIKESGWALKQAMLVPHVPNYEYWSDARNCGRLVLGK